MRFAFLEQEDGVGRVEGELGEGGGLVQGKFPKCFTNSAFENGNDFYRLGLKPSKEWERGESKFFFLVRREALNPAHTQYVLKFAVKSSGRWGGSAKEARDTQPHSTLLARNRCLIF